MFGTRWTRGVEEFVVSVEKMEALSCVVEDEAMVAGMVDLLLSRNWRGHVMVGYGGDVFVKFSLLVTGNLYIYGIYH